MPLAFPSSPTPGQQYTGPNGIIYTWDNTVGAWVKPNPVPAATAAEAQAGNISTKYSSPLTAVPKDAAGMTGSAYLPAGTTAQRPAAGAYTGQFRYNTQIPQLEYSDGVNWIAAGAQPASLAEAAAGTITTKYSSPETAVPKNASGMTGSAYIPAGTTAQRPAANAYTGQFRYNTQIPQLEYSDGTNWITAGAQAASLAEAAAGTITNKYNSPQTSVPKDASGMTGAAILPSGTTAQQPTTLVAGMTRYNTTRGDLEFYTGTEWRGATPMVQGSGATYDDGASILPGGTQAQRPATPAIGMIRYNTNSYGTGNNVYEAYDPSIPSWRPLAYGLSLGVLPNLTVTNGQTLPSSGYYENITIPAGVTCYVNGIANLRARTSITVNGSIVGDGTGTPIASLGPTLSGIGIGTRFDFNGATGFGAGGGLSAGGAPYVGKSYGFGQLSSSSGASGPISIFGNTGAEYAISYGGSGGSSIILISDGTLTVGGGATISMNGNSAQAVAGFGWIQAGGGGGGAGGLILLQAAISATVGGSLSAAGGAGANGGIAGPAPVVGAGGGGGGGGGYIVINSPNTTDTSTKNVSGGPAGADVGVPPGGGLTDGAAGGGFGGAGGAGSSNGLATTATAGSAGQVLLNNYL